MTITTTTPKTQITGDGTTTAIPVPFVFYAASDLEVIERVIATGVETVKALTTHYTVSGGNGSTGTVTALVAPASTVEWHVRRVTSRAQTSTYPEGGPFPSATVARDVDRAAARDQELDWLLARTVRLARTAPAASLEIPATPNRYLYIDANGNLVGAESATGEAGPTGPAGADGADGALWYLGTADPTGGLGAVGDLYLQLGSGATGVIGDVWQRDENDWSKEGNIRGATGATGSTGATGATGSAGATGAAGSVWYKGATDPDNGTGVNGDLYLQSGSGATGVLGDVWVKAGGAWAIQLNIRGATGASGGGSGDLVSTNNLSDVDDAPTARDNLGLGDLAVKDTVATADIDAAAVTFAKVQNADALSVVGRAANTSGVLDEIAAAADGRVLLRNGAVLEFGRAGPAGQAEVAAARVKGRASGASTGDETDLTITQVLDMLGDTRGSVAYRGASGWVLLTPGTAGYVLRSGGTGADPQWSAESSAGEANTGANVGSTGENVFKQKSGVELQFRKIRVLRTTSGSGTSVVDANISIAVVSDEIRITLAVTYGSGGGGGS